MFASLLLAAAAASAAPAAAADKAPVSEVPAPETAPPETAPPEPAPPRPMRGPIPTGSTQPLGTSTPRPSVGFVSAGSLRDRCQATAPGLVSYCFAYITGVHDTVQAYETWLRIREFCPPFSSSQSDLRRAFLGYLKDHPDSESGEAASVIVLAFKDRFSCTTPEPAKAAAKPAKSATKK